MVNLVTTQIVIKGLLTKPKTYLFFALFFTLYLLLALFLQNYSLFSSLYTTSLTLAQKVTITPYLFKSAYQSVPRITLTLQVLIALLFALNLVLLTEKFNTMKKLNLEIGLASGLASLLAAGCSACGISLLAVLGLTPALILLPYHGTELLLLSLLTLIFSLIYNLNTYTKSCKIEKQL